MTNTNDGLDQIEPSVERFITRLEKAMLSNQQESNERMARLENAMLSNQRESNERMARLENAMLSNQRESNERLIQIEQLVTSNSRSIHALADRNAEVTLEIEDLLESQRQADEERAELRQATIGIANLLSSLDEDRPTILRKLNTIENKVDRLLG